MSLRLPILLAVFCLSAFPQPQVQPRKLQVLIVTGRDDHDWRGVTPLMRQYLDSAGIFETRIAEEFRDAGPESFKPYDVATAFKDRPEFARMCGGSYYGVAQHSPIHDFTVTFVDRDHPVTRGLEPGFIESQDELYAGTQMQPAENYHVLATAWDDHSLYHGKFKTPLTGLGADEPVLWTVEYGRGRVFATMLGHSAQATQSAGFRVTFTRGVEWAATGAVTQKPPADMAAPEAR